MLGFRPQTTPEEGRSRLVKWWTAQQCTVGLTPRAVSAAGPRSLDSAPLSVIDSTRGRKWLSRRLFAEDTLPQLADERVVSY